MGIGDEIYSKSSKERLIGMWLLGELNWNMALRRVKLEYGSKER